MSDSMAFSKPLAAPESDFERQYGILKPEELEWGYKFSKAALKEAR